MGFFDLFNKLTKSTVNKQAIQNICLQRCIESIKRYNNGEDTVYVTTSRVCSACCIYEGRILSVFGWDKRFPKLGNMPDFLTQRVCPECGKQIGYSIYSPYIKSKRELNKDIKFSNRPFIDDSPPEMIKFRKEAAAHQAELDLIQTEYDWITDNLPNIAPKSLSGYKRMKNSNSKNYQNIVSKAKEKGFVIK